MPFGLCNAPATFKRLMERVLAHVHGKQCVVYLDDLLVHARDFELALENLRQVFQAIRGAGLRLHPKKYTLTLLQRETRFLGHVVGPEGVATDPAKVEAVRNWPIPRNVDSSSVNLHQLPPPCTVSRTRGGSSVGRTTVQPPSPSSVLL